RLSRQALRAAGSPAGPPSSPRPAEVGGAGPGGVILVSARGGVVWTRPGRYPKPNEGGNYGRQGSSPQGLPPRGGCRSGGEYHRMVRLLHLREPSRDPVGEVLRHDPHARRV